MKQKVQLYHRMKQQFEQWSYLKGKPLSVHCRPAIQGGFETRGTRDDSQRAIWAEGLDR